MLIIFLQYLRSYFSTDLQKNQFTHQICVEYGKEKFLKIYIQFLLKCTDKKSQEYFLRKMIGCDDKGELYKGIAGFMIVGLKESIPYVITPWPETNIVASWLKTELLVFLEILSKCGVRVRAVVCENHPSNMSSFKRNCRSMSTRIRKNYICYTSSEKSSFAKMLSI